MTDDTTRRDRLAVVRERVAAMIDPLPDSSHGEDYINSGIKSALRVIDIALDAPCNFHPTAYGQWCDIHHSPADADAVRCNGYAYTADQVLPSLFDDGALRAAAQRVVAATEHNTPLNITDQLLVLRDALAASPAPAGLDVEDWTAIRNCLSACANDRREPERYREWYAEVLAKVASPDSERPA
jgi:hypothetical protein